MSDAAPPSSAERPEGEAPPTGETLSAVSFPTERDSAFDPPPQLLDLGRRQGPLCRLAYPDGHLGWLVTSDSLARSVLTDPRFSARSEFKRVPVQRPGAAPFIGEPALPGWFVDMDRPEHTRLRRLVAARFSIRNLEQLRPRLERIVERQLDLLEQTSAPSDFVRSFAFPVPSIAICELLGVPYADHEHFQRNSEILFSLDSSADEGDEAMRQLDTFIASLVAAKRRQPGDDLLSHLVGLGELSAEEITGTAVLLLTAGHETVASMLGLGVFVLLCHPQALNALRRNPERMEATIEELLRYLTIFHFGVPRTPLEDLDLAGICIRRGETVTVALAAANRDPQRYSDPNRFDLTRDAAGHLAFGFGAHQCVGQNLARLELSVALGGLLRRFPNLRLAVDPADVPIRNAGFHGVRELPIAW